MFNLETKRDFDVYVSTLFALARDANAQNEPDALRFLAKYLHGLVPCEDLRELKLPPEPTAYTDLPPLVRGETVAKPEPEPEPEPPAARYVGNTKRTLSPAPSLTPRQSTTLKW